MGRMMLLSSVIALFDAVVFEVVTAVDVDPRRQLEGSVDAAHRVGG